MKLIGGHDGVSLKQSVSCAKKNKKQATITCCLSVCNVCGGLSGFITEFSITGKCRQNALSFLSNSDAKGKYSSKKKEREKLKKRKTLQLC